MKKKKINDDFGPEWETKGCPYDHTPNAETLKAIENAEQGIGLIHSKNAKDLFKKCGIFRRGKVAKLLKAITNKIIGQKKLFYI